ncbi:hypothetical protein ACP70R_035671 [Stipagrostis hirtigluma subsp. patula]
MAAPRVVGIALLVVLVVGAELVAVPEARRVEHAGAVGAIIIAANDDGGEAGVRAPSRWNTRRVLAGEKRSVPGGPDPQHHY